MAKTSGAAPPARPVCSLSQYGSQSETVTLTVTVGLAAVNASTIACWFLISAGSPQIEYSRVAGGPEYPVSALAAGDPAGAEADAGAEPGAEPTGDDVALPPHAAAPSAIATAIPGNRHRRGPTNEAIMSSSNRFRVPTCPSVRALRYRARLGATRLRLR